MNFAEFYEWWRFAETEGRFAVCKKRMASVKDVFDEMHADGGGSLDREKIRALCEKLLQLRLTVEQLDGGMAEMDVDGGGEISFHEFYTWWDRCQVSCTNLIYQSLACISLLLLPSDVAGRLARRREESSGRQQPQGWCQRVLREGRWQRLRQPGQG